VSRTPVRNQRRGTSAVLGCETVGRRPDVVANDGSAWARSLRLARHDLGSVIGMMAELDEAETHRTRASVLAQVVILTVIPQATTAANHTPLSGMPSQPELPRPYWSGLSGRLAVIS
jgi:hypothetical protein